MDPHVKLQHTVERESVNYYHRWMFFSYGILVGICIGLVISWTINT